MSNLPPVNDLFLTDRRHKILWISTGILLNAVLAPRIVNRRLAVLTHIGGLPEECDIISTTFDPVTGRVGIILHHESFPRTPEGCQIPQMDVSVRSGKIELTDDQIASLVMDEVAKT